MYDKNCFLYQRKVSIYYEDIVFQSSNSNSIHPSVCAALGFSHHFTQGFGHLVATFEKGGEMTDENLVVVGTEVVEVCDE